ncbi:MAG: hypothetical protein COU29_00965 [Candidatus Magasanikbacteria bacterium CG10_big_fil_rev_8_21_14_0_10_36_32]|uniref:Glycoside hydrolase family 42 N-terminal domain-containing protein n=1 Tax=Candidatus Magasanikbacteria bacterium CG10_big_fil_rev_8_21_14_0_10_36_32 TaxID=1974646 RepID=A0A2M6W6D2_9BACT|nr:MAG: hypothetical protein COU29_00965 [Candidatus Magasanikbacteria bacterium CG10_big_fil_rev_8_21_14_0_10_36_32]
MFVRKKIMTGLIVIATIVIVLFCLNKYYASRQNQNQIYGVSFNEEYADYLKLNSRQVFTAILDDLGFKRIRLSAQWDVIEKEKGKYDFSSLDWYMDEAVKRKVKVILVVGQKIPRWPECHPPKWAMSLSDEEYFKTLDSFVEATVKHYRTHSALEIWQVENEPFLDFGVCRKFSDEMLKKEIETIKNLDAAHLTLVTDSGELSTWQKSAKRGDLFGATLYRVVWNKTFGYFSYDWLTPLFYRVKLWLANRASDQSFIVELQAEPWVTDTDIHTFSIKEQYKSMSPERFQKNIDYAKRVGFSRAYLWGAEWWYWMKEKNNISDFIDLAKKLKK